MPDDSQPCEHQYRRDVESCPYCELTEAEDLVADLGADNTRAWMQVEALTKERDRLQVALERYGDHRFSCNWDTKWATCTCGLEAALEAKEEPGSDG